MNTETYTPLALPETWLDKLADAYWNNRAALHVMGAAFVFGVVMAAAAVLSLYSRES